MTALWIALNVWRVWEVVASQKMQAGGTNPVMAGVAGRLMLLDGFVQRNGGAMAKLPLGAGNVGGIAIKTLKDSMAPHDVEALTELALLQFAQKDDRAAKQSLDDALSAVKDDKKHPRLVALVQAVHTIYLDPALPDHVDTTALDPLHNWYHMAALRKLAVRQKDTAQLKALDSQESAAEWDTVSVMGVGAVLLLAEVLIGIAVLLFLFPLRRFVELRQQEPEAAPTWHWGMGWAAFVMWEFIQVLVSGIVLVIRLRHGGALSIGTLVVMQGLIYLFSVIAILVLVVGKHWERLKQLGLQAVRPFRLLFIGWLGYCAALPIIVAVGYILQQFLKHEPQSDNPVFGLFNSPLTTADRWMLILLVGVVGPIFEEFLFRGVLYSSFRQVMTPLKAMALSAFLFSAIHVDPGAFLPIFVLGFVMAWLFEKTGSLLPNCIIHMMQNTTTTLVALFLLS
ncbi:MAG: CPBP family intramembrane glutamic endopeptidase [Candidatus Xenobia bacterium]